MTGILSRPVPAFDISVEGFTGAARDVGEVIAYLAGGLRPDPDVLSRLSVSMRVLQGFLLVEADEQAGREAIVREVVFPFTGDGMPDFSHQPPFTQNAEIA